MPVLIFGLERPDHAVLQFGCVDGLLVITGLEDKFSLALEGGMLHFLQRLDYQLKKFLLLMFEGGLSSRGAIADNRNFGNVVIVLIGNFFDAIRSGVLDKKIFEKCLLRREFLPRMEVSMKGAESGKVSVLNPFCGGAAGVAVLLVTGFNESFKGDFYLDVHLGLLNDVGH